MNFDENFLFSSLSTLVSSERRSVSNLILASSFTILFYHSSFFLPDPSVFSVDQQIDKSWLVVNFQGSILT